MATTDVVQLVLSLIAGGVAGSCSALFVVRRHVSSGNDTSVGRSAGSGNTLGNNITGDSNLTGSIGGRRNVVASGPNSVAAGRDVTTQNPTKKR
jgi:hypothetical protein